MQVYILWASMQAKLNKIKTENVGNIYKKLKSAIN